MAAQLGDENAANGAHPHNRGVVKTPREDSAENSTREQQVGCRARLKRSGRTGLPYAAFSAVVPTAPRADEYP